MSASIKLVLYTEDSHPAITSSADSPMNAASVQWRALVELAGFLSRNSRPWLREAQIQALEDLVKRDAALAEATKPRSEEE